MLSSSFDSFDKPHNNLSTSGSSDDLVEQHIFNDQRVILFGGCVESEIVVIDTCGICVYITIKSRTEGGVCFDNSIIDDLTLVNVQPFSSVRRCQVR